MRCLKCVSRLIFSTRVLSLTSIGSLWPGRTSAPITVTIHGWRVRNMILICPKSIRAGWVDSLRPFEPLKGFWPFWIHFRLINHDPSCRCSERCIDLPCAGSAMTISAPNCVDHGLTILSAKSTGFSVRNDGSDLQDFANKRSTIIRNLMFSKPRRRAGQIYLVSQCSKVICSKHRINGIKNPFCILEFSDRYIFKYISRRYQALNEDSSEPGWRVRKRRTATDVPLRSFRHPSPEQSDLNLNFPSRTCLPVHGPHNFPAVATAKNFFRLCKVHICFVNYPFGWFFWETILYSTRPLKKRFPVK